MEIANCAKADFDQILAEIVDFWGNARTLHLHHPMLLYEFGNTAYVIRDGVQVIAYLFGFFAQTSPVAYVHLIGVRRSHRRRGLARLLYEHFTTEARRRGCDSLKAITTAGNSESIAFHRSIGMQPVAGERVGEVMVVRDYSGPGQDRVVFHKRI